MKKERHPFYAAMMAVFVLMLLLGIALFVTGMILGPNRVFSYSTVTL